MTGHVAKSAAKSLLGCGMSGIMVPCRQAHKSTPGEALQLRAWFGLVWGDKVMKIISYKKSLNWSFILQSNPS